MRRDPRFFFKHAGYSYDPERETAIEGRWRCAREYAEAEYVADAVGWTVEWEQDELTNRDWTDEGPEYYLWQATLVDADGNMLESLGGVDFGPDGDPWTEGAPYARVVAAELADAHLSALARKAIRRAA